MCFKPILRSVFFAATVQVVLSLTACGGGGGGGGGSESVGYAGPAIAGVIASGVNELSVTVDTGPIGRSHNQMFATVKVCKVGLPQNTTNCDTVSHVLVDSGSTGLRILTSQLPKTAASLTRTVTSGAEKLLSCVQFLDDSYAWGPVVTADVVLGSAPTTTLPIQLVADAAYQTLGSGNCAGSGSSTPITSASSMGANAILGVGLSRQDCGTYCAPTGGGNVTDQHYFSCLSGASCSGQVTVATALQLQNPVFAMGYKGYVVNLPAVPSGWVGAQSMTGKLVFMNSSDAFAGATVLRTSQQSNSSSSTGVISGSQGSTTYSIAFLDTGSNGLFFDSFALTTCPNPGVNKAWYCQSPAKTLSTTLKGTDLVSGTALLTVGNVVYLPDVPVLPTLGGPMHDSRLLDLGLPFFYGRPVFIGIEGQATSLVTGPFYAF